MRPNTQLVTMTDRTHPNVNAFQTAETTLHVGQTLVRSNGVIGRQTLGRLRSTNHINAVQGGFLLSNRSPASSPLKKSLTRMV